MACARKARVNICQLHSVFRDLLEIKCVHILLSSPLKNKVVEEKQLNREKESDNPIYVKKKDILYLIFK